MSRHDYDHAAALVIYIALEPPNRTYAEVARKVGCNPATVAKWAQKYDWQTQLEESQRRVVAKALRTREQIAAQNLRVLAKALDRTESRLDADDVADEFVARVLAHADRAYRLDQGEATDNVAVAEVQAGFRTYGQTALELLALLLDDGLEGRELLLAFRQRLPGLVQERLALIGGDNDA